MKIISGLDEGQVLQRLKSGTAKTCLRGNCQTDGTLWLTIWKAGKPLSGWNRRRSGRIRKGKFAVKLEGIPEGGPYELSLEVGTIDNRYSEILCRRCLDNGRTKQHGRSGKASGKNKPHPLVRAFSQRREWRLASDPLHVHVESPDRCHNYGNQVSSHLAEAWRLRASVGAGVGVPFGREMLKRSGVPQGLICVARGGSSMALWDPTDTSQLYASMLASLRATGQPVAGVLWYQGEADTFAEQAAVYTEKMKKLVLAVRRDLKQPRLPWIMVQLARVFREGDGVHWNDIQEQQRLLPFAISSLECVAAIDLSLDDEIHVSAESFPALANRLARAADQLVYGNRKEKVPPRIAYLRSTVSTERNRAPKCGIDVGFDGVEAPLQAQGEASGFSLVNRQGKELPWIFKTTLHGDYARLHIARQPPEGARVAYGAGFSPRCNIIDGRGMALPVFGPLAIGQEGEMLPFIANWRLFTSGRINSILRAVETHGDDCMRGRAEDLRFRLHQ